MLSSSLWNHISFEMLESGFNPDPVAWAFFLNRWYEFNIFFLESVAYHHPYVSL